jgi:hypothetical protein
MSSFVVALKTEWPCSKGNTLKFKRDQRNFQKGPLPERMPNVRTDDRRRHQDASLVPMGALPRLPDHNGHRLLQDRSSSRRGDYEPHSLAILPIVPTARAVCRTGATVTDEMREEHTRRVFGQ